LLPPPFQRSTFKTAFKRYNFVLSNNPNPKKAEKNPIENPVATKTKHPVSRKKPVFKPNPVFEKHPILKN
ncbi:MAG: hypothetical protein ACO1NX_05305, partial [Chitinophagaceae bacterium]